MSAWATTASFASLAAKAAASSPSPSRAAIYTGPWTSRSLRTAPPPSPTTTTTGRTPPSPPATPPAPGPSPAFRSDGHDGWDDSLAFGPAGALHLLSVDPLQFGSASGVEYARSNNPAGGDAWTVQEIGSGGQPYEWGTSLAVDQAGTVHAVFFDANEQDLVYARNEAPNEGGDWQLQTIYAQDDAGRFPVITLDDTGAPHVAFFQTDARFQPEGPVPGNIVYGTLANGAWTFETVAAVDDHVLGFEGARRTVALRIGPDGPVLAFIDQSSVSLATRKGPSGSVWTVETVVAAAGDPFQVIGLALDPTGAPHLTFATITGNAPLNGEVWYGRPHPQLLGAPPQTE